MFTGVFVRRSGGCNRDSRKIALATNREHQRQLYWAVTLPEEL